ncbi:hypothetical protein FVB40_28425 [Raoultella ornithinolytica]|uniref:hypothetical protein n=1 Tax=Raoultella ornithinolytica TaxID=54291 RepID=UPI001130B7F7|nr:hypothetical protein [Raoultella ornithinolytica]MTF12896.1 hypothetical protein [Raoultella ornithinolytica]
MTTRDDFSSKIKQRLADRVGSRCSYPGCNQVTTGPDLSDSSRRVNTGVAAHNTAAAPGGPRYDKNLTADERSSIDNGIWCCQYHGRLIDADSSTYTTEQLKVWKGLAESYQSELQKLSQSGIQTYSERDKKLLEYITDIFNYQALQALENELFRARVRNSVLAPLDALYSRHGDPAYSFNDVTLEGLRLQLIVDIEKFWRHFGQQSAGGEVFYDYIDINAIRIRSPERVDHFYDVIEQTRMLALNVKKSAMSLLEIRSRS